MRGQKKIARQEEEEEKFEEEDGQDYQPQEEDKDQTIANQKKLIKEMRTNFARTIDTMREQLNEIVEESTEIQTEMLQRIKELKAELAKLRQKTSRRTEISQGSGIPRRSMAGSRTNEVRSSLYDEGPKHPRKLAPQSKQEPLRRNNRY